MSGTEDEEPQEIIYKCKRPECEGRLFKTEEEMQEHLEYHRTLRREKKKNKTNKRRTRRTSGASSTVGTGSLFTVRVATPPPEDISQKARVTRSRKTYKKNAPKGGKKRFESG